MIKYEVLTDNLPYQELYSLMKDSFHEREKQGLNFTVIKFTLDDLRKALHGRPVIIAFDENLETRERNFMGFRQMIIKGKEGHAGLLAVSPKYKRMGIGSKIEMISEQVAIKNGCSFMTSDTSVDATSSVKWHLKNRYFKYKMRSHTSTNYYTVYFRKQLKTHWFWSIKGIRNCHYYISALLCCLYRKKDGSTTKVGRLINRVRHID